MEKITKTGQYSIGLKYKLSGFTGTDRSKIIEALTWVERVINSQEFHDQVLAHKWQGKVTYSSTSKTNEEVMQDIIYGREELNPTKDNKWDLDLELYYNRWSRVVGYTYPNVTTVYMNAKYFVWFTVPQVVNNIVHEHMHKLGYDHDFDVTNQRPYSVPYAVGDIAQRVCEQLMNLEPSIPAPPDDEISPPVYVPWWRRAIRRITGR